MAKYRVAYSYPWAGGQIEVETDETEVDAIVELAYQEGGAGLCHQCAGGRYGKPTLELSDDMEVDEDDDGPIVTTEDGERYKEADSG